MFRSILKGSFRAGFLAASFCVIALSSTAHAKSSLSLSGDVNLKETLAGQAYAAAKKAGDTCPFATKGNREDSTTVLAATGAVSRFSYSRGNLTVE